MIKKRSILFISLFFVVFFIFLSGCTERISLVRKLEFTVGHEFSTRSDTTWFRARPNMNVKLDSIVTRLREFNYFYTVHNSEPHVTYFANQYFWVDWFTNVKAGQVWEFIFYGRYPNSTADYEIRAFYLIR